ncbi:class F sortase [Amycolatopsis sp. Poz14]|uniref:class F sortase n=1 Tax=Amycolatopsis sp. Poz14 TaxID=1447705 RepID=UPI001EE8C8AC|nr:class F sortase [Amycolatopsis sp. Poz14]MCG3752463.1 class F sortase [Amycolatopsis sp. Poz14]
MQGTQAQSARKRGAVIVVSAVVAVAAVIAAVLIFFTGNDNSAQPPQQTGTAQVGAGQPGNSQAGNTQPDPGQTPGTVKLPGGGQAKLIAEEVGADGALPIPKSLGEAAWWGSGLGAAQGVTLLSGHVNWAGKFGPFQELWKMKAGQVVTVADTAGKEWEYKIDEVRTIHKSDLAAESAKLFDPDGPHRLVLVTCGGDYVGGQEGYDDNRVVTASPVTRS